MNTLGLANVILESSNLLALGPVPVSARTGTPQAMRLPRPYQSLAQPAKDTHPATFTKDSRPSIFRRNVKETSLMWKIKGYN